MLTKNIEQSTKPPHARPERSHEHEARDEAQHSCEEQGQLLGSPPMISHGRNTQGEGHSTPGQDHVREKNIGRWSHSNPSKRDKASVSWWYVTIISRTHYIIIGLQSSCPCGHTLDKNREQQGLTCVGVGVIPNSKEHESPDLLLLHQVFVQMWLQFLVVKRVIPKQLASPSLQASQVVLVPVVFYLLFLVVFCVLFLVGERAVILGIRL